MRVAVSPDLGAAVVHPEIASIVRDAADALIAATGMTRVEARIAWPEKGGAWANAGAPGLYADLKAHWPDAADDLTFEIKYAMKWMENYRIWHAASVENFRVEMTEAMADIFEQVDVVLAAVAPVEPFAAEGPMPRKVGEVDVSPFNGGADNPGEHRGEPGDLDPSGTDGERAAGGVAGGDAAARGQAAARAGAGDGAGAAVAASGAGGAGIRAGAGRFGSLTWRGGGGIGSAKMIRAAR